MRRSSRINFFLLLVAVVSLSVICDISVYAATVQYYIKADQTTPLGHDGTANLPAGNIANGIYSTTFTTTVPAGSDTQIRNAVSGTNWEPLGYVYRGADYGGNAQITGAPSGTMYVRSDSNSDKFRFVLIDYNPVSGTKTVLATSNEVNGSTVITPQSITFPAGPYVIPVDHRLLLEIQFRPKKSGNLGRIYCNSSSYPSSITVDETVTGVNHTITASSGGNGTVTPSGTVTVPRHNDQSFSMTPDSGYGLSDVVVDGTSMGPVNPYNFIDVTSDHTIKAVFLPKFTITTSPGANGTITPAGPYEVVQGASQTFAVTPNSGYAIQQVYVDGDPQGPVDSYTFSNVAGNHEISATFTPLRTITASAGSNGSITPGTVTVPDGDSQVFVFSPNSGYTVNDVKVDGVSLGALSSYKFSNITSDHTISVTFTPGPTLNSYCIKPPFLATTIPPNVMIMLSVETPMQGAAHQDLTCEGTPTTTYKCKSNATDVGGRYVVNNYNNSTDYYGYFDSAKCYEYQGGVFKYYKAATSHQCGGDSWSGNFLNFATMTAVDAFRKAFSGGNRDTDAVGNTILLGANQTRPPGDSWYPIRRIDNANLYMPSADGGGSTRYIVRHANGFSVCSSAGCTVKESGSGENRFPTKTGASADVISVYNFRVKVCDPSLGGLEANCNAETNKPEGVIQKYADKMRFGLMSYTNINDYDRDGGVLRTKMKWIIPRIPFGMNYHDVHGALVTCADSNGCANPEAELNASGVFLPNPDNASGGNSSGVINYINKFGYVSGYKSHDPVSELYYEIIRYFKNLTPSTDKYCDGIGNSNDGFMAHCDPAKPTKIKASDPYWRDPFVYPCQQSFVVAVNDANPWLDKRVPGTAFTKNYAATPAYTDYGVPSNADTSINALKWTNKVGDAEGLTPGNLPVGCVFDGSTMCTGFTTTNKYVTELGRVVGTYPSGGKENSYYIAGLSYYAHVNDLRPDIQGRQNITTYMIDTQEPQKDGMLVGNKNMLFLAAKFGGFREIDGSLDSEGFAKPFKDGTCGTGSSSDARCAEWDENGDGLPDNYFFASDPTKIEEGLNSAFSDILRRMASGTAASILNNSEGSGASLIQAIFYPEREFDGGSKVQWSGELHSLWYYLDPYLNNSTIREDSDKNFYLDLNQDKITQFYFNGNETLVARYSDTNSDGAADGAAVDTDIIPDAVNSLWRAGFSLFSRDLSSNPRVMKTTLDGATLIDFKDTNKSNTTLQTYLRASGATATDLENDTAKIINYIRGTDQSGFRSRTVKHGGITREWRLGDIISSTPKLQSTIRLNSYNLEAPYGYNDTSYDQFIKSKEYGERGNVYVGANDGMLHAFKLGILDVSGQTKTRKAYLKNEGSGSLGDEMWTFIPKNVLPYLKYYTEPKYDHLYYVDNTVSIVDASIHYTTSDPGYFPDCTASKYWNCEKRTKYVTSTTSIDADNTSWKTILIGGMGLGGASRFWGDTCSTGTDCVKSPLAGIGVSSYFALDVTDPSHPSLKWEFSDPDLGYTTTGPAIVRVGPKNKNGRWFAVFGSGPSGPIDTVNNQFLGASDKTLKLFIIDLNAAPPFIKGTGPNTPENANYWVIDTGIANAFAGSLANAVIDTDRGDKSSDGHYSDDAVYVGYVKKSGATWTSGGVGRIFTKEKNDPAEWVWNILIDNVGPVTTSVTKSQDRKNKKLWIYFGTGRYFFRTSGTSDDPDSQRTLFGIMEPCYYTATYPKNDIEGTCTDSVSLGNLNDQTTKVDTVLSSGDKGWYINLDTSALNDGFMSERVITDPVASSSGAVFFTTFRPTFDVCSFGGNTYIWSVRYDTGAEPPTAALKGKALMQVSTGSFAELSLSSAFTSKNNRRTTTPIKGVPPKSQGLSLLTPPRPSKKVLQIQEK